VVNSIKRKLALKILKQARNSIGEYCMNECKAKCCRKGKLVLFNENEVNFICQNEKQNCENLGILTKTKYNNYNYDLEKKRCPYLTDDFKCSKWKDPNRPKICKDFPLFLSNEIYIITADFCPAVKEGKLDKYLKQLKELGFKII
jgi:hypothetical protein